MKRSAGVFALAMILTGCTMYSLVKPQRTAIGDFYTVEPQRPWSSISEGKVEVWTVDGPALEAIRIVKGLEDDEVLFEGKDEEHRPKFRKQMTATEILEVVVDSFTLLGAQAIEARNLRPETFGNVEGFRFEMKYLPKEGLEMQGFIVGAVMEERLHLIMYTGTKAYYFPKYRDDVERIIRSIEMPKREA